ncbi:MAG TPA: 23S rRNA (guanosine(2251)-2'-O)-methyltransferase RlmB [Elusimicrobiota bacterium]|nr:23S rRNA (guanosine(2251)-2'-O)-methyltransferase RlmB [Elusimicrobiota bacterium]
MNRGGEWIFGAHAVEEILRARPETVKEVLIEHERRDPALGDAARLAKAAGVRVRYAPRRELDRLSGSHAHQGLAARADLRVRHGLDGFLAGLAGRKDAVLLALDEIQDPHNLGAIGRSALNLGAAGLIIPERRASPVGATAMRASAGALGKIERVEVINLGRALEACREKGFWIYGADMGGRPLWEAPLNLPLVLVLGSEGRGLRPGVRSLCDEIVSVPQAPESVESLNVSCAAAVLLYEIRRRGRAEGA